MMYALINNGTVTTYPYSFRQLRKDNPDVSFPEKPTDEKLIEWGVYPVVQVVRPDPKSDAFNVVEGAPELIKGVWTQVWEQVAASQEEIDLRAAEATKRQEDAARMEENLIQQTRYKQESAYVKADSFVANFIAMTPQEVEAYVSKNVTNLASAKSVIEKLAIMVLLLAKRELE